MMFHELNPEVHNGRRVEVAGRTGRLSWGQDPQYKRIDARQWYLIIPNDRFGEVAMSTWTIPYNAEVVFLD